MALLAAGQGSVAWSGWVVLMERAAEPVAEAVEVSAGEPEPVVLPEWVVAMEPAAEPVAVPTAGQEFVV